MKRERESDEMKDQKKREELHDPSITPKKCLVGNSKKNPDASFAIIPAESRALRPADPGGSRYTETPGARIQGRQRRSGQGHGAIALTFSCS